MMLQRVAKAFRGALFDIDGDRARNVVREAVEKGATPEDILLHVIIPALSVMDASSTCEGAEMNIAQHFIIAQIASDVTEDMIAKLGKPPQPVGKVVMGTSRGDFHGLGKKLLAGCLRAHMIEVIDLGLDVRPERFVDQAIAHNAEVIAISSLMMHTARGENGCSKVREILAARRLEDKIKIIVGGAPYCWDPQLYKVVGADVWAENAIAAGPVVLRLIAEVHK
jgi:trimethylamine corrinoid protein